MLFIFPFFPLIKIRWRNVKDDDESQFRYLEQEVYTNSSRATKYTVTQLQPFTVYSFHIAAINHVGRSRPSKNSYPAITLRERKLMIFNSVFHTVIIKRKIQKNNDIHYNDLSNFKDPPGSHALQQHTTRQVHHCS